MKTLSSLLSRIDPQRPVLIAGPTASGKSALALAIAQAQGGTIVNADASQVYACWRILTARPSVADERAVPHVLYGHVAYDIRYSAGHWLRDALPLLSAARPIFVGGTGLYFSAITEGLAEIPPIPQTVRAAADTLPLDAMVETLDPDTIARIDTCNRARVQRAWEVAEATGRTLAQWQNATPPPALAAGAYTGIVLDSPKDWLNPRIETRFNNMLRGGALDEARAMRDRFDASLPSCKAIGVSQAMARISGEMTHDEAVASATIATRQYAKRQRTWFRARLSDWEWIAAPDIDF